jgi:hypothetical protein
VSMITSIGNSTLCCCSRRVLFHLRGAVTAVEITSVCLHLICRAFCSGNCLFSGWQSQCTVETVLSALIGIGLSMEDHWGVCRVIRTYSTISGSMPSHVSTFRGS